MEKNREIKNFVDEKKANYPLFVQVQQNFQYGLTMLPASQLFAEFSTLLIGNPGMNLRIPKKQT